MDDSPLSLSFYLYRYDAVSQWAVPVSQPEEHQEVCQDCPILLLSTESESYREPDRRQRLSLAESV